jgi:hypothetical protein
LIGGFVGISVNPPFLLNGKGNKKSEQDNQ